MIKKLINKFKKNTTADNTISIKDLYVGELAHITWIGIFIDTVEYRTLKKCVICTKIEASRYKHIKSNNILLDIIHDESNVNNVGIAKPQKFTKKFADYMKKAGIDKSARFTPEMIISIEDKINDALDEISQITY